MTNRGAITDPRLIITEARPAEAVGSNAAGRRTDRCADPLRGLRPADVEVHQPTRLTRWAIASGGAPVGALARRRLNETPTVDTVAGPEAARPVVAEGAERGLQSRLSIAKERYSLETSRKSPCTRHDPRPRSRSRARYSSRRHRYSAPQADRQHALHRGLHRAQGPESHRAVRSGCPPQGCPPLGCPSLGCPLPRCPSLGCPSLGCPRPHPATRRTRPHRRPGQRRCSHHDSDRRDTLGLLSTLDLRHRGRGMPRAPRPANNNPLRSNESWEDTLSPDGTPPPVAGRIRLRRPCPRHNRSRQRIASVQRNTHRRSSDPSDNPRPTRSSSHRCPPDRTGRNHSHHRDHSAPTPTPEPEPPQRRQTHTP